MHYDVNRDVESSHINQATGKQIKSKIESNDLFIQESYSGVGKQYEEDNTSAAS